MKKKLASRPDGETPTRAPRESPPVRLAVIGTGGMARHHARAFAQVPGCRIVAAVDIEKARVEGFCRQFAIPSAYTDLEALLEKEAVDAVSIVAPDPAHAPLSIRCLEAGKHVLCEKPLALNHAEAERMVAAARRAGTVTMVNFSYRNGAAIHLAATLVAAGRLGELRHIEASYLQSWLVCKLWGDWRTEPGWLWRLSKGHGSQGVLGDIGVHILDFATYPAGPIKRVFCRLKTFPKIPGDRVGDYQLDANDSAVMNVEFENGAIGTIHTTRWATGHINRLYLKLSGTKGSLEIDTERSDAVCRVCLGDDVETARWRERQAPAVPSNYARFIRAIQTGEPCEPDFERGAEIQRIIDACFASAEADRPVAL